MALKSKLILGESWNSLSRPCHVHVYARTVELRCPAEQDERQVVVEPEDQANNAIKLTYQQLSITLSGSEEEASYELLEMPVIIGGGQLLVMLQLTLCFISGAIRGARWCAQADSL